MNKWDIIEILTLYGFKLIGISNGRTYSNNPVDTFGMYALTDYKIQVSNRNFRIRKGFKIGQVYRVDRLSSEEVQHIVETVVELNQSL